MNLESSILQNIRLSAPPGVVMFRNQVGAYKKDDFYIKYGVGGEGGSDLICIVPTLITQRHVGRTIARFGALEVKTKTGHRSPAQINFINRVVALGGIGGFPTCPAEAQAILNAF